MVLPALPPVVVQAPDVSALTTEDDAPVDNRYSEKLQRLLTEPLYSSWSGPPPTEDGPRSFLAAANIGLFATTAETPLVPDVLLSLDVPVPADLSRKEDRSYFMWLIGKPPEVVIEIVSNREGEELGRKLRRYRRMRVSYYVVYDPLALLGSPAVRTFELRGDIYAARDRPMFETVGLGLVEWDGTFERQTERWLRWCTLDGTPVPTGAERAERLAARLRTLGFDADEP